MTGPCTLSPLGDALRTILPAVNADLANGASPADWQRAAETLHKRLALAGLLIVRDADLHQAEDLLGQGAAAWPREVAARLRTYLGPPWSEAPDFLAPRYRR